ncbi:ComF family protein [Bacillus sp. RG28]|uniref:ComF family protein n=1 Tax=Gottfriedia endophytica TaxID=2820819 RepID=A0A940NXC3_9BACI|nr:ComF family protein [Gottfriedia endophytica]MBP0726748.1 ComF family protein [Gottfriedia endophytica]
MVRFEMICVICNQSFHPRFTFRSLLFQSKQFICEECNRYFVKITGPICQYCGRMMEEDGVCVECESLIRISTIQYNRSIYCYNEGIKSWMNAFKFRGDVAVAEVVIQELIESYIKLFSTIPQIVPIPISEERLQERGFNQVEILCQMAKLPLNHCLGRKHSEKQSKLTRKERLAREQLFFYKKEEKIQNEPILLIDDFYTTGKTVRDAAKILLENGASEVYSLTLVRV